MADRILAAGIIIIAALSAAIIIPLVWFNSLPVAVFPHEDIRITDVQFELDALNITVKNLRAEERIVSEVTIRDLIAEDYGFSTNPTSTSHTVAVYEPIPAGEEISFRISFKWTSGCAYQIELETANTDDWSTALNVVAP